MSLKPLVQKGVEIDWKAWKLPSNANPTVKPEGYREKAKQFLGQLLNETGLNLHPPSKKHDTYLAHIGAKFAKEKGLFDDYNKRIFQAVWEKNEDIEDINTLCEIAKEVGLDQGEYKESLYNRTYKDMVEADFQNAIVNHIWTIPTYIGSRGEIQVHHFKDKPDLSKLEEII